MYICEHLIWVYAVETLFIDCSFVPTQEYAQAGAGQGQETAFCCINRILKTT